MNTTAGDYETGRGKQTIEKSTDYQADNACQATGTTRDALDITLIAGLAHLPQQRQV